jgi:glycosyltransferase involved in cell wall biosynthesis
VVGHLRAVKDPLLAARAAALLPGDSRVRIVHIGAAIEPAFEALARETARANPRYVWLGALSRRATLVRIARSHALALTSRSEGGSNVVAEAVMAGTPPLATRIDGTLGQLGPEYSGYFEPGDENALAQLMRRAESDRAFYGRLLDQCARLRPRFEPAREREGWRELLGELRLG